MRGGPECWASSSPRDAQSSPPPAGAEPEPNSQMALLRRNRRQEVGAGDGRSRAPCVRRTNCSAHSTFSHNFVTLSVSQKYGHKPPCECLQEKFHDDGYIFKIENFRIDHYYIFNGGACRQSGGPVAIVIPTAILQYGKHESICLLHVICLPSKGR